MVVHHAAGRPAMLAHAELQHIAELRATDGLIAIAEAMLPLLDLARTEGGRKLLNQDPAALKLREQFNGLQEQINIAAEASQCPDVLHEARDAVMHAFKLTQLGELINAQLALQGYAQGLNDAALRLGELCECALNDVQAQELLEQLRQIDASIQLSLMHDAGHLMAWQFAPKL
jgi:hypothetical protein